MMILCEKNSKKIFLFFDSVIIEMTSQPNLAFEIRDYIHLRIFFSDKWIMVMCDQYRVIIFYWSNSESHFVQIKLITLIHLKCYSSILLIQFFDPFKISQFRLSQVIKVPVTFDHCGFVKTDNGITPFLTI